MKSKSRDMSPGYNFNDQSTQSMNNYGVNKYGFMHIDKVGGVRGDVASSVVSKKSPISYKRSINSTIMDSSN